MRDRFLAQARREYPLRRRLAALPVLAVVFLVILPAGLVLLGARLDRWLGWPRLVLQPANAVAGGPLIVCGWLFAVWSIYVQFTVGRGTPVPLMATQKLIIQPPYSYCRNPMALGAIVLYFGVCVAAGSPGAALLWSLGAVVLLVYIRLVEEKEMVARFGEEYAAYRRRTPFLIPRWKRGGWEAGMSGCSADDMRSGSSRGAMDFLRLWLTGYLHPGRAFEALRDRPAPHYGLYGMLMRGLIVGLAWYLPRALMGLRPSMAPALPFPPVETYYWHALWYFPVFELAKWLLTAAIMHLALRLIGRRTDYDVLLNLSGVGALIIDPAIRIWDWIVYAAGWSENTVVMGAAHALVFWPWGLVLAVIGMRKLLGLPARVVVPLQLLVLALFIPLAATFLRP